MEQMSLSAYMRSFSGNAWNLLLGHEESWEMMLMKKKVTNKALFQGIARK